MSKEQALKNILKNILMDIDKTGRTNPMISVVRCEIDKDLIEIAQQYTAEDN